MSDMIELTPYRQRLHRIETLRHRCRWLSADDQVFMQMVFDKGSSFQQIARLTGQNPSTVNRRFKRLVNLLIDREVMAVLRRRPGSHPVDLRIVRDYYLRGQSQKAIARRLNISLYRVQQMLKAVRIIINGSDRQPARPSSKSPADKGRRRPATSHHSRKGD